jgi:phosphoenolpyruvate carboxykinase (ATP)
VRECAGHIQVFRLAVPTVLPGVPTEILNPVSTWKDKDEFDKT